MTEPSFFTTHPISHNYPVIAAPSLASPLPNGSLSDTNLQEEEEYTIKCICIYTDDDGNTVYCPKCDTWQHIECYYHGKKVPEEHFCADCFPRDLDAKKATERQRRHREALDGGDRKVKRPGSKSQKKKHKESNPAFEQINGWHSHDRHESTASIKEGPPAKKPKTNHRTSGSIVSVNGESRKRAASTTHQSYPSPSKSPQEMFRFPAIPTYTAEFLELYDRDEGNIDAHDNEQTIQAANKLSAWRSDSSLIVGSSSQQPTQKSPFVRSNRPLDQTTLPTVAIETVTKPELEFDGKCPTWRFLRLQTSIKKDEVVGEVRGQVGTLEEYCQQRTTSNRWPELRHPDPFVFFHPHMDIYIDSRKSGTQFRYLRRSCKPNVTLKTIISADDETHHCIVASKDIPAGSELTTTWFLDAGMFSVDAILDASEQAQNRRLDWVSRVLANFGDCACDAGSACLLANFDRRYPAKSPESAPKEKAGRKKKSKTKYAVSPFSTGHATNSRAGSEPKVHDDDDQFDRHSTSGSSPSGAHSRDITPVNVAALDADPVLGSGLTARELRKIQMAERAFAQKEQEKKDPNGASHQRKKKRTSGGSNLNTPNASASKQIGFRSTSHPPTPSAAKPSPPSAKGSKVDRVASKPSSVAPRPVYIDAAVQTEPEEEELLMPPPKRRKFCTPTQRLLKRLFADRIKHGQEQRTPPSDEPGPGPLSHVASPDVDMPNVDDVKNMDQATSPTTKLKDELINVGTSTYPLPSQAAHHHKSHKTPVAPRLHLSTLPPVPIFSPPGSTGMGLTPTPGPSSLAQSPLAIPPGSSVLIPTNNNTMITPSPARKKLSLGDYMSRRNLASTPVAEKGQSQGGLAGMELDRDKEEHGRSSPAAEPSPVNQRPNGDLAQQAAAQGGLSGSAVEDTVMKDEMEEPEYSPPGASPVDMTSDNVAFPKREGMEEATMVTAHGFTPA